MLQTLDRCMKIGNSDSRRRAAHALKGSLLGVGAEAAAATAKKIEEEAERKDRNLEPLYQQLCRQVGMLAEILRKVQQSINEFLIKT